MFNIDAITTLPLPIESASYVAILTVYHSNSREVHIRAAIKYLPAPCLPTVGS